MNERELRKALAEKQEAYNLAKKEGKSTEELCSIVEEVKELRAQLDLELEMRSNSIPEKGEVVEPEVRKEEVDLEEAYKDFYVRSLRGNLTAKDMQEFRELQERAKAEPTKTPFLKSSVDENGGFIIPADVQTQINEYKRAELYDLSKLVTVEHSDFLSGTRVFEKLAEQTPFENFDEWDTINDIAAPQFEQKSYKMKNYGGILPVPRQLLQDSKENLLRHLAKYIARKSVATRNYKILEILNGLTKRTKDIVYTDDLKKIVNVELDGAFSKGAKIVTNQDGFNWLDTCKDENGNYLMQKDVTSSTGYSFAGREVEVAPNSVIKTVGTKAPVFVGDLKEAITLFDRDEYETKGTDVGGDAFKRNTYDIRTIDRFDVTQWDIAAVIATQIDISKEPAFPSTGKKTPQA